MNPRHASSNKSFWLAIVQAGELGWAWVSTIMDHPVGDAGLSFMRILVGFILLLWVIEKFHAYGTNPKRARWIQWLAERLAWLAQSPGVNLWAVVIALVLALGFALATSASIPTVVSSQNESTPRPRSASGSSTSLTALQLMDLMATDTPNATAIAQSQVGWSLQVQGRFHNVMIMPPGPTSENWFTRPSQLAAQFMVALEDFDEYPGVPKRVAYVYVASGQEQEAAVIQNHTEVVARGIIERITSKSINITDATILAIQ